MSNGILPSYLSMAKPNPAENRAPWYKNTAPTYAGIFLWFVFWSQMSSGGGQSPGGILSKGIGVALLSLIVAALLCHFLFYLVPGLFGLKTGLPLYVVGTSTYGTQGGFLMPGFLMGVLQFGWLGVNIAVSEQRRLEILDYIKNRNIQEAIERMWDAIEKAIQANGMYTAHELFVAACNFIKRKRKLIDFVRITTFFIDFFCLNVIIFIHVSEIQFLKKIDL